MNIELGADAREFGRTALRALEAAGGDELVQAAERQPEKRAGLIEPVLDGLGAWELDPHASTEELEAAAALCRSAGWWAIAYPVAERLCRPIDLAVEGLLVVCGPQPSAAVAGLSLTWAAVDLGGERAAVSVRDSLQPSRKSAFVTELDVTPLDDQGAEDLPLALILPCWTLLGMLDRAVDLTCRYVREREQFGQSLASFQSVQFQLTDAQVERVGLEELAKHALWSVQTGRREALEDALALRLAAIEAAETVFRVAHQLHGAMGFCDETTLSWVSRYSQPLRRLPLPLSATRDVLTRLLGRHGLTGLFSEVDDGVRAT